MKLKWTRLDFVSQLRARAGPGQLYDLADDWARTQQEELAFYGHAP